MSLRVSAASGSERVIHDEPVVGVTPATARGTDSQPWPGNNYTAAILIEDRDGGTDRYEIEVEW